MLYGQCVSVAMETHFHLFQLKYQNFENSEGTLLTLSHNILCKNNACWVVAREHHRVVIHNCALQQRLNKEYYCKNFLKILILQREYMELCFHGNQHLSSIKHHFISLCSKYQFFMYFCFPNMNSPIFQSLDNFYCMLFSNLKVRKMISCI